MCVTLEFVDMDGIVAIVDVATTVVAAAAVTVVAAMGVAADMAAVAATTVAAADAAVITDAAAATTAADVISVRAPGARYIGKASAIAIGKASVTQSGTVQDTAVTLPPVQPEGPDQLSPKAAAVAAVNIS